MARNLMEAENYMNNHIIGVLDENRRNKERDRRRDEYLNRPQYVVTETYEQHAERQKQEYQYKKDKTQYINSHTLILGGISGIITGLFLIGIHFYSFGFYITILGIGLLYWFIKQNQKFVKKLGLKRLR